MQTQASQVLRVTRDVCGVSAFGTGSLSHGLPSAFLIAATEPVRKTASVVAQAFVHGGMHYFQSVVEVQLVAPSSKSLQYSIFTFWTSIGTITVGREARQRFATAR